jgi:hypothetical protein
MIVAFKGVNFGSLSIYSVQHETLLLPDSDWKVRERDCGYNLLLVLSTGWEHVC